MAEKERKGMKERANERDKIERFEARENMRRRPNQINAYIRLHTIRMINHANINSYSFYSNFLCRMDRNPLK